jgi:glycosyltransferase involved in cell wall biosynthesis
MASNPLVSIVTPSFNQARFIEETLRSVELQRYRPIHQVVIDGASTDGTVDLLRQWEARDHGPDYTFEWISEQDRGHADALNKGFRHVRGEIVVTALQAHAEVDMVHGEVALISEDSGLQMILCYPKFDYDRALRGYMVSQPTVFLRRTITDRYRLNPTARPAIDFDYWLQIGKQHKFLKLHRILAGDRDHGARISRTASAVLAEAGKKVCREYGRRGGPSRTALLQDLLLLRILRITALLHLILLLFRKNLPNRLAFAGWIDSVGKVLARQMTMRVNSRGGVGPKRPTTEIHAAS